MCPGSSSSAGKLEACQLGGGHPRRELQQCEGVPTSLGDDPLSDAAIEPAGHDTRQQCACILFGQPIEVDVGQPVEVVPLSRLTHRYHDRHRLARARVARRGR